MGATDEQKRELLGRIQKDPPGNGELFRQVVFQQPDGSVVEGYVPFTPEDYAQREKDEAEHQENLARLSIEVRTPEQRIADLEAKIAVLMRNR